MFMHAIPELNGVDEFQMIVAMHRHYRPYENALEWAVSFLQ